MGVVGVQYIEPKLILIYEDKSMNHRFSHCIQPAAFLLMNAVIWASIGIAQQTPMQSNLSFLETDLIHDMARPVKPNSHEILIERAREVELCCSWGGGDLAIKLIDPQGNPINTISEALDYNIDYEFWDFPEGFVMGCYSIEGNYPTGTWTMQISTNEPALREIGYTVDVYLRDPELSVKYFTNKEVFKTDELITITTVLQRRATPVFGATVLAIIAMQRNIIDTLILYDDGFHNDSLANDGRYASNFHISSRQGDYYVQINVSKTGDNAFAREDDSAIMFIVNNSSIIGPTSERIVDEDGDGLYDRLIVGIDFDLTHTHVYEMYASLYDQNDKKITSSRICNDFPAGRQSVEFSFDGSIIFEHGVDGPYLVKRLTFSDSCDYIPSIDSIENVYTTKEYDFQDFERGPIFITGKYSINELDIDGDGLYDSLIINFEGKLEREGNYKWEGQLGCEVRPGHFAIASVEGFVKSGISDFRLSFSGSQIRESRCDGVYTISAVWIHNKLLHSQLKNFGFKTREYKHTEFQ